MITVKNFLHAPLPRVALLLTLCLLCAPFLSAQESNADLISRRFNGHAVKALQEKSFVHTDKQFYIAGEICWFKLYLVDGTFHKPLNLSKVAYVEVLDNKNTPVLQAKISVADGVGNGSLTLPVTLSSGNYRLRAYTRWMQNFSPDFFFETDLTVINTRKIYQVDSQNISIRYQASLFPEGGHLVNGVDCVMACQLTDQYGHGSPGEGWVVMDDHDTISHFLVNIHGVATFAFTPMAGHRYQALLQAEQQHLTVALPVAADKGYALRVDAAGDSVRIRVQTSPGLGDRMVTMVAHTRQAIKIVRNMPLVDGLAVLAFDKNKLGEGISHITIFNELRQPVSERLVFRFPAKSPRLSLSLDKPVIEPRQKLSIAMNMQEVSSTTTTELSMAIYRADSLQPDAQENIMTYLLLTSDLQGRIDQPTQYFLHQDTTSERQIDNLMLTQGWRKFNWDDITSGAPPAISFAPEISGHVINGRVTKINTNESVKDVAAYLSVPGSRAQFYCNLSDSVGNLKFFTKDFYNQGEVIVQVDKASPAGVTAEVLNPFSNKHSAKLLPPLDITTVPSLAFVNQNVNVQVENAFSGVTSRSFSYPKIDTSSFFGPPDVSYKLDNYVRFTTMEEVLREYVTPVNVRKKDSRYHLPVFDAPGKRFFEDDPLVLIDGVPVGDLNKVMQFDPLKVAKMDIKSRTYFRGNLLFSGIVSMNTYQGDLAGLELDPRATVIDYDGLQLNRSFAAPTYTTDAQRDSHYPDFRTLLSWSPSIHLDAQTKIELPVYSSDVPGRYLVVVQGVTSDGQPVFATYQFDVKQAMGLTAH